MPGMLMCLPLRRWPQPDNGKMLPASVEPDLDFHAHTALISHECPVPTRTNAAIRDIGRRTARHHGKHAACFLLP